MKQLFSLVLTLLACSKPAGLTGDRIAADVPDGWRLAEDRLGDELASGLPEIPSLPDGHGGTRGMKRRVLVLQGQPAQLPGIAIYELAAPTIDKPELTAPQANLMSTVAKGVVGGDAELTDQMCRRFAERFAFPIAEVAKVARDRVRGCDLRGSDGIHRIAILWIDDEMTAFVACTRGVAADRELDRACDRVIGSIQPTTQPRQSRDTGNTEPLDLQTSGARRGT